MKPNTNIHFEWDTDKDKSNQKKHGVSFIEAQSVFYDEHALQFFDDEHSSHSEERFLMLGMSIKQRLLLVCHCVRNDNIIRLISARKATRTESNSYTGD
ncbi:MAG: BrnT family toxin [Methylococcaceae bacterium]|nr:BrnT family toxin [Methylococcaceae bacterium]